jgi:hypothetical protein
MSVTISGGRIASIAPSSDAVVPHGMKVVNAAGKYLIPGLWDMHVHLTEAPSDGEESALPTEANARTYYFPLLVANGVLGVRDMAGMLDTLISFRRGDRLGQDPWAAPHGHGIQTGSAKPVVSGAPAPVETAAQVRTASGCFASTAPT